MNPTEKIQFSAPVREDSPALYALIKRSPPLDLNSRYAYMLVATHFANTSVVAKVDGEVVGLVSAYVLPEKPDTLFVWQVAVDASMRGAGLAQRLVYKALESVPNVRFIETTITPSNVASQKLFERIASQLETAIESKPFLPKTLFGEDAHEDENLYVIGPIHNTK